MRRTSVEPLVVAYPYAGAPAFDHAYGAAAGSPGGGVLATPQSGTDTGWAAGLGLRRLAIAPPESLALSPDRRLAAVGRYQTVEVWDVSEQTLLHTIPAHRRVVQAVALSPDGRTLATRSFDDLALWDLRTGEPVGAITELAGPTCALAFSPDGTLLASGHDKTNAALWRVADLTIAARFPVNGFQHAVAFSPDGGWLATAGQDEVVRVWPVGGGPPVTLYGPATWVDSLAFTPDGRTLAATSAGRVHLWTCGPEPIIPARSPSQPTWPALLAETTGLGRPFAATATEFTAEILRLPWFAHIGQPSAWDDTCVRLADWTDCPPPPDNRDEFVEQQHLWIDAIKIAARTFDRPDLTELFERTRRQVIDAARRHVPYDDSSDSYDPPTFSVWDAAYVAASIACFLELGWRIPVDLERRWAWFAAGHWPCEPDRTGDGPPYRLRVL
ncbi:hypothetical protein [Micromonospora sp. NPDC050200]|uniref:WD40 repeat domain-containing protein n=1 Tax=Micromonospora sp. NPDC050200 TaxID=3155664 RepID=UPI0033ED0CFA